MAAGGEIFDDVAFYYVATAFVGTLVISMTLYIVLSFFFGLIGGSNDDAETIAKAKQVKTVADKRKKLAQQNENNTNNKSDKSDKSDNDNVDENKKSSRIFSMRNIILVIGWVLFIYLFSLRHEMKGANLTTFEPYEILNIQYGASEHDIKKAYRKLSLKWHPDVHSPEDRPVAEEKFMLITKAYYTLTDPATRDNYERYGNPDGANSGPASVTYGLPAFLSDKKNEVYVLIGYLILFTSIPAYIFMYFKNQPQAKTYNDTGVMNETIQWFMGEMEPNMGANELIEITSLSHEFRTQFKSNEPTPERLEALKTIFPKLDNLPTHKHPKIFYIMYGNALFHAYLQRVDIPAACQDDLNYYLQNAPKLHALIAEISRSNRGHKPFFGAIDLIQATIQRIPLNFPHPFLQLLGPNFTENNVTDLFKNKIRTLNQLRSTSREEIIKILGCKESSYDQIMSHIDVLPKVKIDMKPTVNGCDIALPKDILEIEYSLKRLYDTTLFPDQGLSCIFPIPKRKAEVEAAKANEEKMLKMSKEERKLAKKAKLVEKIDQWDVYIEKKNKPTKVHTKDQVPDVYSITYPYPKKEVWYLALFWVKEVEKEGKVEMRELLLDSRVINNFADTPEPLTGKLLIQLPDQPGLCTYRVVMRCDSYLGCDFSRLVQVMVDDPNKAKKEREAKLKAKIELIEEDVDTGETTLTDADGKKRFLAPGDLDKSDNDDDENNDDEDDEDDDDDLFQDELNSGDDEDLPTYWYYLGGSTFFEGVCNLVVFAIIGFLIYHYCHNMIWWKRFVQPNIDKGILLAKPYYLKVEEKLLPFIQPVYMKLDALLRWFLGDDSFELPLHIKLEKAYNARGRGRF